MLRLKQDEKKQGYYHTNQEHDPRDKQTGEPSKGEKGHVYRR